MDFFQLVCFLVSFYFHSFYIQNKQRNSQIQKQNDVSYLYNLKLRISHVVRDLLSQKVTLLVFSVCDASHFPLLLHGRQMVRGVGTPQRMMATRFLGQKLNDVEQQSVTKQ